MIRLPRRPGRPVHREHQRAGAARLPLFTWHGGHFGPCRYARRNIPELTKRELSAASAQPSVVDAEGWNVPAPRPWTSSRRRVPAEAHLGHGIQVGLPCRGRWPAPGSLATPASFPGQTAMRREPESLEECLKEAAECERLAALARLESTRRMLELSARYWRNRAVGRRNGSGRICTSSLRARASANSPHDRALEAHGGSRSGPRLRPREHECLSALPHDSLFSDGSPRAKELREAAPRSP